MTERGVKKGEKVMDIDALRDMANQFQFIEDVGARFEQIYRAQDEKIRGKRAKALSPAKKG